MVDWSSHYDAIYSTLGVAATIITPTSVGQIEITAIDKTVGVVVGADVEVNTVWAVAAVRAYELADKGVVVEDLNGGSITLNGKTWRIRSHLRRPSPMGESDGEIYLKLSDT